MELIQNSYVYMGTLKIYFLENNKCYNKLEILERKVKTASLEVDITLKAKEG